MADPAGARPSEGAYLNYPLDDLLRLLALESVRHRAVILGEDLGTVPEGLRETLAAKAVLGMRVLPFEQQPPGHFKPILDWPDNALATTGTHDLAPWPAGCKRATSTGAIACNWWTRPPSCIGATPANGSVMACAAPWNRTMAPWLTTTR